VVACGHQRRVARDAKRKSGLLTSRNNRLVAEFGRVPAGAAERNAMRWNLMISDLLGQKFGRGGLASLPSKTFLSNRQQPARRVQEGPVTARELPRFGRRNRVLMPRRPGGRASGLFALGNSPRRPSSFELSRWNIPVRLLALGASCRTPLGSPDPGMFASIARADHAFGDLHVSL
jgi:hypothetical protein